MHKKLAIIILAAGRGKRLGGKTQKVARKLLNKPLLLYIIDTIDKLSPEKVVIIVGYKKEEIFEILKEKNVEYAEQLNPLGTGHAVLQADKNLNGFDGDVLILCGDVPLISKETLSSLIDKHRQDQNVGTILSVFMYDPFGYGRIKRDSKGSVHSIVEEINATAIEKEIKEINSGIYIFNSFELFNALKKVKKDKVKGEYYLTDVIKILYDEGKKIDTYTTDKLEECLGINTDDDFKRVELILKGNNNE